MDLPRQDLFLIRIDIEGVHLDTRKVVTNLIHKLYRADTFEAIDLGNSYERRYYPNKIPSGYILQTHHH